MWISILFMDCQRSAIKGLHSQFHHYDAPPEPKWFQEFRIEFYSFPPEFASCRDTIHIAFRSDRTKCRGRGLLNRAYKLTPSLCWVTISSTSSSLFRILLVWSAIVPQLFKYMSCSRHNPQQRRQAAGSPRRTSPQMKHGLTKPRGQDMARDSSGTAAGVDRSYIKVLIKKV